MTTDVEPKENVEPSSEDANLLLQQTVRRGRMLFFFILTMGTIFCFFGLKLFVLNEPSTAPWTTYIIFSVMALLSFLYGVRFVKNYIKVRATELMAQTVVKRKETLVIATAVQLLLIEFVCVIGLFLSIFTQIKELIFPFYFVFLIGLYFSYPKADWYEGILKK